MIDSDFAPETLSVSDLLPLRSPTYQTARGRYVATSTCWRARWLRPRRSWHHRGVDDSEPDSASAEALIGCPIGPWELRRDGCMPRSKVSPPSSKRSKCH